MSLINCAECGHEVSVNADACPNCGRPVHAPPVAERKVVVAMPPPESGFPTWAFVPIGIAAIILMFVMYIAFRPTDEQANTNVNVNLAGRRTSETALEPRTSTVPPSAQPQTVTVPGQPTTVSGPTTTAVPGSRTSVTSVPATDKGIVVINARVAMPRGGEQAVRNAKFYLLDRDLESILSEARVEPIEGNSLKGSLGLALVYPDRYGDFQRAAMRAIASHAKYSGSTDGNGKAGLAGIVPQEYYLFGITRVGRGFALWDSPVSVVVGQNILNLSPQSVTEIPDTSG